MIHTETPYDPNLNNNIMKENSMEESVWTMEVGELFTVEREECASIGLNYALCRLEGGLALSSTHVEYREPVRPGVRSTQVFVFKCIEEGDAAIQFGYSQALEPGIFIYEEVLPIKVVKSTKNAASAVTCIHGGWSPARDLCPEEKELFHNVMGNRIGISYTPIKVSTQVVAGTNYCFTCATKLSTNPPKMRHAQVFIFEPLPGQGEAQYVKTVFLLGE